jgi:hypothetical protein
MTYLSSHENAAAVNVETFTVQTHNQARSHVVRENDPIIHGGPSQNTQVGDAGKADVLNANNVKVRLAQQQCAYNVAIEVLIGQQPQHLLSSRPSPGEQASADFTQVALLTLNSLPNFLCLLLALS